MIGDKSHDPSIALGRRADSTSGIGNSDVHVIITLGFSHEHRLLISRRCSLSHKRGQGIALEVSSARKVSSEVITYTMKYTTYT